MCDVHTDAGVAGARAPGYEANTRISGQFPLSFGHVGRARFVTARHKADDLRIIYAVEHLEVALTWDAECRVDVVRFQRADEDSPTGSGV